MLARRSAGAGALWMKFADHHRAAPRDAAGDVAQNSSRIVGVVQDHCDQRRVRLYACGLQHRGVRDDPLNLTDAALALQALQISERIGGAVERINDAGWPHALGKRKTDEAGAATDFEHPISGFETERV